MLIVTTIFCFGLQASGQEKGYLAAGSGLPELINFGVSYQLEQIQRGLYIGSFPRKSDGEAVRTFSGDVLYHFGGSSELSNRRPWYWKVGLDYLRNASVSKYIGYSVNHTFFLNTRIGRDFNHTNEIGIFIDIGPLFCLSEKYVTKHDVDRGCEYSVSPGIGTGLFVRILGN